MVLQDLERRRSKPEIPELYDWTVVILGGHFRVPGSVLTLDLQTQHTEMKYISHGTPATIRHVNLACLKYCDRQAAAFDTCEVLHIGVERQAIMSVCCTILVL